MQTTPFVPVMSGIQDPSQFFNMSSVDMNMQQQDGWEENPYSYPTVTRDQVTQEYSQSCVIVTPEVTDMAVLNEICQFADSQYIFNLNVAEIDLEFGDVDDWLNTTITITSTSCHSDKIMSGCN